MISKKKIKEYLQNQIKVTASSSLRVRNYQAGEAKALLICRKYLDMCKGTDFLNFIDMEIEQNTGALDLLLRVSDFIMEAENGE